MIKPLIQDLSKTSYKFAASRGLTVTTDLYVPAGEKQKIVIKRGDEVLEVYEQMTIHGKQVFAQHTGGNKVIVGELSFRRVAIKEAARK